MLVDDRTLAAKGLIDGDAVVREPQQPASRRLRSSTGSRRMSSPFTSRRSNAQSIALVLAA